MKKTKTRQSGKAKLYKCDKCDQNCIKVLTLKKYNNTVHTHKSFTYEKCHNIFSSEDLLHLNIQERHTDKSKSDMECPLCEDRFVLSKAYDIHIKKHLEEIQGIDIDCL